jgi:hypothetical protein
MWDLRAIFRGDADQIIAAATWNMTGNYDLDAAEAQALHNSMNLAAAFCFCDVEFESDNLRLINTIGMNDEIHRNVFGDIVREIHCRRAMFRDCNFVYTDSIGNYVAHAMAQLASSEPNRFWIEEAPTHIVNLSVTRNFARAFARVIYVTSMNCEFVRINKLCNDGVKK